MINWHCIVFPETVNVGQVKCGKVRTGVCGSEMIFVVHLKQFWHWCTYQQTLKNDDGTERIQVKYQCKMVVAHKDDCTIVSKVRLSSFDSLIFWLSNPDFLMLNVNISRDNLTNALLQWFGWDLAAHDMCISSQLQVTPKCSPKKSKCTKGVLVSITTASGCTVSTMMMMMRTIFDL